MQLHGAASRALRFAPVGAVLVTLAASAAVASKPGPGATHGSPWGSEAPKQVRRVLGDHVKAVESGLYKVNTDRGRSLVTHGADTRAEIAGAHTDGSTAASPEAERNPVCASDHYQRFLYAHPSGASNRIDTVRASIQEIVRGMDATLNRDSLDSGGPTADYRVHCDSGGAISVGGFASPGDDFDSLVSAARAAGFDAAGANYTIFYDDGLSGYCGVGSYIPDETPGATNVNNLGGGYAIVYSGCWDVETAMHENGHNQGAVQYSTPNSTGDGAHCYDEEDIMCYSPDGGDRHQGGTVGRCSDRLHFDCNHDDYFDSAPAAGSYLATHWNLGSSVNRFLAFGAGQGDASRTILSLRNRRARRAYQNAAGGWRYFRMRLPSGRRRLRVTLSGPSCATSGCQPDLDLYLRRRGKPVLYRFHCRSSRSGSSESCVIRRPRSGRWYAGVYTYRDGAAPFRIVARY